MLALSLQAARAERGTACSGQQQKSMNQHLGTGPSLEGCLLRPGGDAGLLRSDGALSTSASEETGFVEEASLFKWSPVKAQLPLFPSVSPTE